MSTIQGLLMTQQRAVQAESASHTAPAAIVIENLTQTYVSKGRAHTAVASVDLSIGDGEFVSIVGPSDAVSRRSST
ncbi:hypothetical protein [Blastococcus sp. PRF04-17]|uniref:hypothetical protein n=1 Tax=Blastococcus sp. PRF04-17 TaxID=2933797 RepID=UPI001FF41B53|nr:hypothetical protein [Blastococcus sp. PRF04-17]UOY03193.1 hypothetical protein MVA48_07570 [Blastococcus sp. PRF04-17]